MHWLRLYTEIIADKKLRRLPAAQRWLWVAILALAGQSEEPGRLLKWGDVPINLEDLAQAAAVGMADVEAGLRAFAAQDMIHYDGAVIVVTHWQRRQFSSDNSTARVQKHRAKKGETLPGETFLETFQETTQSRAEAEQSRNRAETESAAKAAAAGRESAARPDREPPQAAATAEAPYLALLLRRGCSREEIEQAVRIVTERSSPPAIITAPSAATAARAEKYLFEVIQGCRQRATESLAGALATPAPVGAGGLEASYQRNLRRLEERG